MVSSKTKYRIGEVYMMLFEGTDSEQNGWRPGLIIQNNKGNLYSPNLIVLPLTSVVKKANQPTHVVLSASKCSLRKDSVVLCENPECISKTKIGRYVTTIPDDIMELVAEASLVATGVISFLSPLKFDSVRDRVIKFNMAA